MGLFTAGLITLTAASAVSQYAGQRSQAKAVERSGRYNQQVAELQAEDALVRGQEGEQQLGRDTRSLIGTQQTVLAASGIDASSGTALRVQEEAATLGEFDRTTLRNNAQREAWGYRTQGTLNMQAASNEAKALRAGARNSLLAGGAQIAGIAYGASERKKGGSS